MKRGISPLLAEVLLIGLAVSLIAGLIAYGNDMFKKRSEETTENFAAANSCNRVEFNVKKLKCDATNLLQSITITNDGESEIDAFRVDSGNQIFYNELDSSLEVFGATSINGNNIPEQTEVKIIPAIKKGQELQYCGNKIQTIKIICP